jgi:hypothetical protein
MITSPTVVVSRNSEVIMALVLRATTPRVPDVSAPRRAARELAATDGPRTGLLVGELEPRDGDKRLAHAARARSSDSDAYAARCTPQHNVLRELRRHCDRLLGRRRDPQLEQS